MQKNPLMKTLFVIAAHTNMAHNEKDYTELFNDKRSIDILKKHFSGIEISNKKRNEDDKVKITFKLYRKTKNKGNEIIVDVPQVTEALLHENGDLLSPYYRFEKSSTSFGDVEYPVSGQLSWTRDLENFCFNPDSEEYEEKIFTIDNVYHNFDDFPFRFIFENVPLKTYFNKNNQEWDKIFDADQKRGDVFLGNIPLGIAPPPENTSIGGNSISSSTVTLFLTTIVIAFLPR